MSEKDLKILILATIFSDVSSGGENTAAWEMANALAERGVKIFVLAGYSQIVEGKIHPNIKIYKMPFAQKERNTKRINLFKTFLFAWPVILFKKIDVIHWASTQGPHPFAFFKIKPFACTADLPTLYDVSEFKQALADDRAARAEWVNPAREDYGFLNWNINKFLDKFSYYFFKIFKLNQDFPRTVDLYVCRKTRLIDDLKTEGYNSKFVSIPMAVNLKNFFPKSELSIRPGDVIKFLYVGTINKKKGLEYLILAFNKLSEKYKNIELLVIGPGAPSALDFFKNLVKLGANVNFLGEIVGQNLPKYYQNCDVFVQTAFGCGYGLYKVSVEAMACAKPVILSLAYDTAAITEKVGFWVKPGDVEELTAAMEKFIINPSLLKEMGTAALKYVERNHSWDILAQRLQEAYRSILRK